VSIEDTLRAGPINLPVRYLLFMVAAAVGYATMSLLLRRRGELRRLTANRFVNAIFTFVLVWKLEPLAAGLFAALSSGRWEGVWLRIFIPGGLRGSIAGTFAALLYIVASVTAVGRKAGNRDEPAPPVRKSRQLLWIGTAVAPLVGVYLVASIVLAPNPIATGRAVAISGPPDTGGAPRAERRVGTAVGDRAPAFAAETLGGSRFRFEGSASRAIVLNFWATWCPPCRAELPDLVRFSSETGPKNIQVWSVNMTSTESSRQAVREFARSNNMEFPVLVDPEGSIAHAYGVTALPTTFIIAADGTILAKQVGAMSPSWLRSQSARATR